MDVEETIGRSLFSEKYKFMPRRLMHVSSASKNFWVISRITEHDTIAIEVYDPPRWKSLDQAPRTIDDNTMIRAIFHGKFSFRFIFLGGLTCQDVSILEDIWLSPIWDKPVGAPVERTPTTTTPQPALIEQRAMTVMDWLAGYIRNNSWAAIIAIAIAGLGLYLWLKK